MATKSKSICFSIPYPDTKRGKLDWNRRFSLNAYWSGKHPMQRSRDAKYFHALTMEGLKAAKVKRDMFVVPVEVIFRWDDRLDCDNHSAMGKMILDALKKSIIQDDNPRWVRRVTHEFWDGGCVGVEVRPV